MERHAVNVTTGDLDALARLTQAQREIGEIADALFYTREGSKREQRKAFGRRLNTIKVSLHTVELAWAETMNQEGQG